MNDVAIKNARAEAVKLIERIDALERAKAASAEHNKKHGFAYANSHPKEHSALRRTSMDLTRALAEMRRP